MVFYMYRYQVTCIYILRIIYCTYKVWIIIMGDLNMKDSQNEICKLFCNIIKLSKINKKIICLVLIVYRTYNFKSTVLSLIIP